MGARSAEASRARRACSTSGTRTSSSSSRRTGSTAFFELEGENVRDVRRRAIKYAGYAVGFRGGHVQVRIDLPQYRLLKAWFEEEATRRSVERLAKAFYDLPFEPYYLVRRQEFNLLRAVNRRRKAAGLPLVPKECIWLKRRPVKPFGQPVTVEYRPAEVGVSRPSDQGANSAAGRPDPDDEESHE